MQSPGRTSVKREITTNDTFDFVNTAEWAKERPKSTKNQNQKLVYQLIPERRIHLIENSTEEYTHEDLRQLVKDNLKTKEPESERNVYFTASETGENFSFEKDKSRLVIDPSAPFGELIDESCQDNPQSDTKFPGLLPAPDSPICELEIEMKHKYDSPDMASPKFGVKTFDFHAKPEKPIKVTPRKLCKKESLSTIEERSFDVSYDGGTNRSKNYSSMLS